MDGGHGEMDEAGQVTTGDCARAAAGAERSHREGGFPGASEGSDHLLRQLALGVLGGDHLQGVALDLRALAFAAELEVALLADQARRLRAPA